MQARQITRYKLVLLQILSGFVKKLYNLVGDDVACFGSDKEHLVGFGQGEPKPLVFPLCSTTIMSPPTPPQRLTLLTNQHGNSRLHNYKLIKTKYKFLIVGQQKPELILNTMHA